MVKQLQPSTPICAYSVVQAAPSPTLLLDASLTILAASLVFVQTFTDVERRLEALNLLGLDRGKWDLPVIRQAVARALSNSGQEERAEVNIHSPEGHQRPIEIVARQVPGVSGPEALMLITFTDLSETRAAQRERYTLRHEKSILVQQLLQHRILRDALCENLGLAIDCADQELLIRALSSTDLETSSQLGAIVADIVLTTLVQSYPEHFPTVVSLSHSPVGQDWSLSLRGLVDAARAPPAQEHASAH